MCVHDKYVITLKLREGVKVGKTAAQYLQNNSFRIYKPISSPSAGNNTIFS